MINTFFYVFLANLKNSKHNEIKAKNKHSRRNWVPLNVKANDHSLTQHEFSKIT